MPRLSEIQILLLSHASRQVSGSLYPLPETLGDARRTTRPIAALLRAGLIEERETTDAASVSRIDSDLSYGLYLTAAGSEAIGVEPDEQSDSGVNDGEMPAPAQPVEPTKRTSKIASVVDLLRRDGGASLADLIEATGWLPHTTRAALTGLRKKGHAIEKERAVDTTRYRIVTVPAVAA